MNQPNVEMFGPYGYRVSIFAWVEAGQLWMDGAVLACSHLVLDVSSSLIGLSEAASG